MHKSNYLRPMGLILSLIGTLLGSKPTFADSQQKGGDWRFLDSYASTLIAEAHGTDLSALEATESAARRDSSPLAKSYVHLARALQYRMQFRLEEADREAVECIQVAATTHNGTAEAFCGWLRLNLARVRNDFPALVSISNNMASANHALLDRAGITEEDASQSSTLFFLTRAASYQDMAAWPTPTVQWQAGASQKIKLDTSHYGYMLVEAFVGERPVQFDLDTGSGRTVISPELAREWNLTVSKHREYQSDVRGNPALYGAALIPSIRIGSIVVHNLPVLIGSYGFE